MISATLPINPIKNMSHPIEFYRTYINDYLECLQQLAHSLQHDVTRVPDKDPYDFRHGDHFRHIAAQLLELRAELIHSEAVGDPPQLRSEITKDKLVPILDHMYDIFYTEGAPISRWDLWSLLDDKTNPYHEWFQSPENLELFAQRGIQFFDEFEE